MDFPQIKKILIITLFFNWLVAGMKIGIGIISGSLAIFSEGLHSFFDGTSNIIGLIGVTWAQKPKDANHPYGHQKFETIASLGIIFLILLVSYELSRNIYQRLIFDVRPEINNVFFVLLFAGLFIDWFIARYEYKKGKELKSVILTADAAHTRSHVLTTFSVIFGAVAVRLGYPIFDTFVAIFIVFWLIKLSYEIFRETSAILSDESLIETSRVVAIAAKVVGADSVHQIRMRGDLNHTFLDMHLALEPTVSLEEAHQISFSLKQKITETIPEIKDIVIHLEPKSAKETCKC